MIHSYTFAIVLTFSVAFQPEPVLCQESTLLSFTCNINGNTSPPHTASNTLINRLDALADKLDTLQSRLNLLHQPGSSSVQPADSCAALLQDSPGTPSGYYWIRNATGHSHSVYCDMTRSCGGVTGGWRRVATLNITDSSQECPSGLREHTDGYLRTCGITSGGASCSSVILDTSGIQYSQVCGKVIGYQYRSTDAFRPIGPRPQIANSDIDSNYVDGVSLTRGVAPERKHIWTFASALGEQISNQPDSNCPCTNPNHPEYSYASPPSFVGDDYFCDTGNEGTGIFNYYTSDPLWDGAGCGSESTCCSFNTPPWFYKQLPQNATDDIEMRVCSDQSRGDEDMRIKMYDIFVQ